MMEMFCMKFLVHRLGVACSISSDGVKETECAWLGMRLVIEAMHCLRGHGVLGSLFSNDSAQRALYQYLKCHCISLAFTCGDALQLS